MADIATRRRGHGEVALIVSTYLRAVRSMRCMNGSTAPVLTNGCLTHGQPTGGCGFMRMVQRMMRAAASTRLRNTECRCSPSGCDGSSQDSSSWSQKQFLARPSYPTTQT